MVNNPNNWSDAQKGRNWRNRETSLIDFLGVGKSFNVNEEVLEGNASIDTVLASSQSLISQVNEFVNRKNGTPLQEREIKDVRYRSTQVNNRPNTIK